MKNRRYLKDDRVAIGGEGRLDEIAGKGAPHRGFCLK
jgi:hypothetical protein